MRKRVLRFVSSLTLITVLVIIGSAAFLYFFQHKMIYHPRPYRDDYIRLIPPGGHELNYRTTCGNQTAFYIPPISSDSTIPSKLWIMFGGNASLALFWGDTIADRRDATTGFLLVDYPGYGKSEGNPTPEAIDDSANAALTALSQHLGTETPPYFDNLHLAGHSLGSGAALAFSRNHEIKKIILVAPFTSLRAVARQTVGNLHARLLRHHFDNDQILAELARRPAPPEVIIIHGTADDIIPVNMSRQLKQEFPEMITYREIPGGDHASILDYVPDYM